MCSSCGSGSDYENPDATAELQHGYAGMREVDASNYQGKVLACLCGEKFMDRSDLDMHIAENCPHTDSVRWSPIKGCFICGICNTELDIPELLEAHDGHPDQDVSFKL